MLIQQLRQQQSETVNSFSDTLKTVELNITELCNRTCSFCPRHNPESYPNQNLAMTTETLTKIVRDLKSFNFNNRVGLVGFGEPFLHKNLTEFVSLIRATLPDLKWLEINTNSDFLTIDKVKDLYSAGCNQLTISMYDRDISEQIKTLISGININVTFKHLYAERMELNEVNRDNILTKINIVNKRETCYLPFYKMFIDYDGKVLVCNNDWGRQGVIGDINVHSLYEIWNSDEMLGYRKKLLAKDRDMNPCKFCNINGALYGKDSFDYYEKYLNQ
jgi:radical SAM protein with 4Fe4S-binding SPASM domain